MKILIAGAGKIGSTLTRQLSSEGYDLTLIDSNSHVLESSVERYDVMSVQGNCASMDVLKQADVESADLLIAATGADEINLLCCMTAHGLNPNIHTIARIRNPEYTEQVFSMRDIFALSMMVNPERQAATEIERLLSYPGFLKRDTFAKGRLEIVELRIDAKSKLCNVALNALPSIVKCRVLVCAVLREGTAVAPSGNFVLQEGDRIFVTATTGSLATLLKNLNIITHKVKRVLIAGGGRISLYLAQQLERNGMIVQLIEKDYDTCVQLATQLPSSNIINGDASIQSLLESEGLEDSDALITLTGMDELNIIISLYGNKRGIPQIITKLGHVEDSSILSSLPLGSVVSPKELCCSTIVRYVRAMQNQTGAAVAVSMIADGQVEAMEFHADDTTLNCGTPLKKIKLKPNVLIVGISHGSGSKTEIPNGDSVFYSGDTLIIVTVSDTVINQLNDIFE